MFQESISSSSGYCCFNHIEQESMITIPDFHMTDDSATFSNQNNCGYSIANNDHKFVNENVKSDVNLMSNNGDDNFSCFIGNMNSIGEKCSNDTWHNNGDLCFIIGNLNNFYNYSYSENCSGEVFNPDFEIPEITYHDSCEPLSKLSAVKIDEYNPPCYSPIEPSFPSVNHSNNFSLSINNNIMMKNKITTMNNEINYKNINNNLINNHIVNNICSNHNSFSQNLPIRNIDNYERQCLESNWINYTEEDYNLNFLNNDDDNDSDNSNMGHSNFQCSENDLGLLTQKLEENLRFVLSPILLKKKYSGMKKHGKKSDNTHACHICSYEVLYSILEKHIDILSHFTDRVYKHIRKEMNREENLVIKPAICNYLGADKKSGDRYCDLIIIQAVQSKRKCDKIIKEVNVINRITNIWKSVNKSKFPPNLKTAFRTEFSQLTDPSNIPIISPRASIDRYM